MQEKSLRSFILCRLLYETSVLSRIKVSHSYEHRVGESVAIQDEDRIDILRLLCSNVSSKMLHWWNNTVTETLTAGLLSVSLLNAQ